MYWGILEDTWTVLLGVFHEHSKVFSVHCRMAFESAFNPFLEVNNLFTRFIMLSSLQYFQQVFVVINNFEGPKMLVASLVVDFFLFEDNPAPRPTFKTCSQGRLISLSLPDLPKHIRILDSADEV